MKNIFITGGAGYIGSHAVKLFLENGYGVTVFDNLSRGYKQAVEELSKYGQLEFVKGDLKSKKDLVNAFDGKNFEAVIHFAALCLVNESMQEPEIYFENNVLGSLNLLEVMKKNEIKNIVFSSTCATYGDTQYLPVDEGHPQNPSNPYGESKFIVERMMNWFGTIYGMKYVILRYFNVCGADKSGNIGDSKKPSQLLMQNAVRGAMGIEPFFLTCGKVDTPDETPIRDYIDVSDLADAHLLAYKYLENGGESDVFNLGNGAGYSVLEIINKVEEIFGVELPRKQGDVRKGEYAKIYADSSKANKILGWEPNRSLEDSVLALKNWYSKHPNGYEY